MSQDTQNTFTTETGAETGVEENKPLYLTFVVDRSGSMMSCGVAVFQGIRDFINKQMKYAEEQKLKICLTIFTFDDKIDRLEIPEDPSVLKTEHYEIIKRGVEPRGFTRLYDTIHQAAMYTTSLQENRDHTTSSGFMVIITDGEDNRSEIKQEDLKNEIESHKKTGMEYVFIGANIDARRTGTTLGISENACMQFTPDPTLTQSAFSSLGLAVQRSIETDDNGEFQFTQLERFSSCSASDRKKFDDSIPLPSYQAAVDNFPGDEVPDMNDGTELWANPLQSQQEHSTNSLETSLDTSQDIFNNGVNGLLNLWNTGNGDGGGGGKKTDSFNKQV